MVSASERLPATVQVCPPEHEARALWLAFAGLPTDERNAQIEAALATIRTEPAALAGLYSATRNGQLVGAAWSCWLPGRLGAVWPPYLVAGEPEGTADELLRQVLANLESRGTHLVQAMLSEESQGHSTLLKANFQKLADLLLCVSEPLSYPTDCPNSAVTLVKVGRDELSRLGALAEATYVGTLDCPGLNGLREIRDVLVGYAANSGSGSEHWYFVRDPSRNVDSQDPHTQDVGCLLLNAFPERNQWELVYMGLIPAARGRGWGSQVVRLAQWVAGQAGCQQLVLAMDVQNHPAITMYTEAGFSVWGKRLVWVKSLFKSRRLPDANV